MTTRLGALRLVDPARFEKELRRALRASGGHLAPAAEAIGVSTRQLARWLAELPDVPRAAPGRPWDKK